MTSRARRRREEDLLEAAFRALIAGFGPGGRAGPTLFFLSVRSGGKDKDPRPAFMARFLAELPDGLLDESPDESPEGMATPDDAGGRPTGVHVLKGSRAKRAAGFVTDRRTGRMGVLLWAMGARWEGEDRATVRAGWLAHVRDGERVTLRMERLAGRWVVRERETRGKQ
jgi:hypothetical protein